ncbi:hypothetical protein CcaverHIS631_0301640 [Cutaneotrichosporon cavernicola]|nr:hypothetical protein CcaverHIS631_0301640 [Cutaneotrichosporon cavernicola]
MLASIWAVLKAYWDLGFTSFGGPGVHVVLLRKRFVNKLNWVDQVTFLDLFALGNALPGPGSTQLAFSIAVVAQDTPTDERRVSAPSVPSVQNEPPECESESGHRPSPRSIEAAAEETNRLRVVSTPVAIALLLGFVLFLTTPLATRAGLQNADRTVPRALDFFSNMVVAGTIIFGGGPVVIPLLRDYVVVEGWVTDRDFLLIFAILQAFPGPNFNFAVALGALAVGHNRGLGAFLGYVGIFGPGILLKLALLPLLLLGL